MQKRCKPIGKQGTKWKNICNKKREKQGQNTKAGEPDLEQNRMEPTEAHPITQKTDKKQAKQGTRKASQENQTIQRRP